MSRLGPIIEQSGQPEARAVDRGHRHPLGIELARCEGDAQRNSTPNHTGDGLSLGGIVAGLDRSPSWSSVMAIAQ